ncbi:hypothetical protein [Klebsiella sp. 2680]|uniref:hypothetical protein n=1 Tax=Klebsiella sp. 2680 TaxID=2018037 RepID=UPI001159628D|nr:hypothetical protein [Klebsiella sp. 2680]
MKRTIFYSWQSDLPSKSNRNIIEEALKRSLSALKRDENETVEPVLDRDTAGTPGSPSISDTIFKKISTSDVFIADVSIINASESSKKTSNPNVLIELGFAISQLGWDRIILIQNTLFGGPEELPFDLRGRRVVTYSYGPQDDTKSEVRGVLQGRLENALKYALKDSSIGSLQSGSGAPVWWGEWINYNHGRSYGGHLFIRETSAAGFLFDLSVYSGSHSGKITSQAIFVSRDMAYAKIPNYNDEYGEISFRRNIVDGKKFLSIEETASCSSHRGMGVIFSGEFQWSSDNLFELGFLNELDLQRIYNVMGSYYFDFKKRMEGIGKYENLDTFEAKVFHGGVRGMYTYMEGIIMISPEGGIWVAYLDDNDIKYFTNDINWKEKTPKTIDNWCSRFQQVEIKYISDASTLPHDALDEILKNLEDEITGK